MDEVCPTLYSQEAERLDELVNVYNDQGLVIGCLTEQRLAILHTEYTKAKATAPGLFTALGDKGFVQEVAKLLHRYPLKNGNNAKDLHGAKRTWSIDSNYMEMFAGGLNVGIERFALPLDFNPQSTTYYSLHEQDRVFGANVNAYSKKWRGSS